MTGSPMAIDSEPFQANLLISSNRVKARYFHFTKHFIYNLYAINDGGEFRKSFLEIYPKKMELKIEHQGNT